MKALSSTWIYVKHHLLSIFANFVNHVNFGSRKSPLERLLLSWQLLHRRLVFRTVGRGLKCLIHEMSCYIGIAWLEYIPVANICV